MINQIHPMSILNWIYINSNNLLNVNVINTTGDILLSNYITNNNNNILDLQNNKSSISYVNTQLDLKAPIASVTNLRIDFDDFVSEQVIAHHANISNNLALKAPNFLLTNLTNNSFNSFVSGTNINITELRETQQDVMSNTNMLEGSYVITSVEPDKFNPRIGFYTYSLWRINIW